MDWVLVLYVVVLCLVSSLPMVLDVLLSYRFSSGARKAWIEKIAIEKLGTNDLKELIAEFSKAPPGIRGLSRATMALTVIVVLGIAILHMIVKGAPDQDSKIIENILSMLAGLLAAITGFYFGGRASSDKAEGKTGGTG